MAHCTHLRHTSTNNCANELAIVTTTTKHDCRCWDGCYENPIERPMIRTSRATRMMTQMTMKNFFYNINITMRISITIITKCYHIFCTRSLDQHYLSDLSPISTTQVDARVDRWPVSIIRQACWRARVSTSWVDGRCWWPVNSANGNRA